MACPEVAESALFAKEHGVHAVLPFVARFFPKAKIVPVALRIDSKRQDWLTLVDALVPLVDSKTLVVQSTDFSHYLDHGKARRRDQQTMNTLAPGDPEAVARLRQPEHLDSRAAQFVQMALQRRLHDAGPLSSPTGTHRLTRDFVSSKPRVTSSRFSSPTTRRRPPGHPDQKKQCGFSRVTRFSAGASRQC